jgi:hypothetical protein
MHCKPLECNNLEQPWFLKCLRVFFSSLQRVVRPLPVLHVPGNNSHTIVFILGYEPLYRTPLKLLRNARVNDRVRPSRVKSSFRDTFHSTLGCEPFVTERATQSRKTNTHVFILTNIVRVRDIWCAYFVQEDFVLVCLTSRMHIIVELRSASFLTFRLKRL